MTLHVVKDPVIDSIFLERLLEIESLYKSEGPELYGCEVSFFVFLFFRLFYFLLHPERMTAHLS